MNEMALRDAQTNEHIQELTKEGQDLRLGGKKSQQEALAALARVEALVNRTHAMLPPKLAKLGRLDKTPAWVRAPSAGLAVFFVFLQKAIDYSGQICFDAPVSLFSF